MPQRHARRGEVLLIFLAAMLAASPLAARLDGIWTALIGAGIASIAVEVLEGRRRRRQEQRERLTDVFR